MVLLVGGGEGMGPLEETAQAIDRLELDFGLAVVAGRNTALKSKIMARDWVHPTFIYGFEQRMPDMMRAASLLVTKAGPGTITEALNAGLPMVLYSYLPGQETGNIEYVIDADVGLWAPGPERTADAVHWWLTHPLRLQEAVEACRRIARPQAARDIAAEIVALAFQQR
jgi:1,2-diacylglycerol 3-beta-galactosyltransferase